MSKDDKDKSRTGPVDGGAPFHNPFGALAPLRATMPISPGVPSSTTASEGPAAPTAPAPAASKGHFRSIPRAVVRLERSGRGGKEVTVVEHLDLQPTERERWLKALKAGLGCGGVLEGNNLVLQGDQRDRLPKLLTARGVRKVTIG